MATLAERPVDRPPVCFYELNGLDEHPAERRSSSSDTAAGRGAFPHAHGEEEGG